MHEVCVAAKSSSMQLLQVIQTAHVLFVLFAVRFKLAYVHVQMVHQQWFKADFFAVRIGGSHLQCTPLFCLAFAPALVSKNDLFPSCHKRNMQVMCSVMTAGCSIVRIKHW